MPHRTNTVGTVLLGAVGFVLFVALADRFGLAVMVIGAVPLFWIMAGLLHR